VATRGEFLAWCAAQVGTREDPVGSNRQRYAALAGHANGAAWCATFLVAGARITGLQLPDGAGSAWTPSVEAAFKRAGRLGREPKVGAFAFVYFPSLGRVAHVGVVWKVEAGQVRLIEGNTNQHGGREGIEVAKRIRPIGRRTGEVGIRSYGYPAYTAPSVPKPKPLPKPQPSPQPRPQPEEDDMRAIFVGPEKEDQRPGDHLLVVSPAGVSIVWSAAHRRLLEGLGVPEEAKSVPRRDYDTLRRAAGLSGDDARLVAEEVRALVAPSVRPT
jgi:hypothetical protein